MSSKQLPSHSQQQQEAIIKMVQQLQENLQQQNEELLNIQQQNGIILQMNAQLRTENAELHREIQRRKDKERSGCCCVQLFRLLFPCCVDGNRLNEGYTQVSRNQHSINQENQR